MNIINMEESRRYIFRNYDRLYRYGVKFNPPVLQSKIEMPTLIVK